jgi:hypothetical protein
VCVFVCAWQCAFDINYTTLTTHRIPHIAIPHTTYHIPHTHTAHHTPHTTPHYTIGKVQSWAACKNDAIKRNSFWPRRIRFLRELPAPDKQRLAALSNEPRDDAKGEEPGSPRKDEEEKLFMASLAGHDRDFLEAHRGLGNSQKAEVAWLEKMGYDYEELDVSEFQEAQMPCVRPQLGSRNPLSLLSQFSSDGIRESTGESPRG